MNRRGFLLTGLAAAVCAPESAEAALRKLPERSLHLYNIHTGEWLKTVYWADGRYQPQALAQVRKLLRDHRSDTSRPMDPALLDLMAQLHRKVGGKGAIHIISGYRSPETNAMLAANSDGVASHSLHMDGRAVDVRLPGQAVRTVGRAARSLKGGGVGIYPASNFVHMDTGRVRTW